MKNNFPRIVVPPEIRRKMIEIAREFRKEPTKGEKILWEALRGKRLDGIKFRRQQPIGYFVVDFYSSAFRLAVEIDGPIHDQQMEADRARQEILEILGLTVLRITQCRVNKSTSRFDSSLDSRSKSLLINETSGKTEIPEKNLLLAQNMIREKIQAIKRNEYIPSSHVGEGQGGR
jgi:very-short-patch-repair endonuclease